MLNVNIRYFAMLKEIANKSNEQLCGEFKTVLDVYNYLNEKYNFPISFDNLQVSVNAKYCEFSTTLNNNDIIVFIPPVAGG